MLSDFDIEGLHALLSELVLLVERDGASRHDAGSERGARIHVAVSVMLVLAVHAAPRPHSLLRFYRSVLTSSFDGVVGRDELISMGDWLSVLAVRHVHYLRQLLPLRVLPTQL